MKIKVTTEKEIKFQVCAFIAQEGGMDYEVYGKEVDTMEEALFNLDLATKEQEGFKKENQTDWVITLRVTTKVSR